MKRRIFIAVFLCLSFLVSGGMSLATKSPISPQPAPWEVCTGWPYMPHPDWPDCVYNDECICWLRPSKLASPLEPSPTPQAASTPVSALPTPQPQIASTATSEGATSPTQSNILACIVASRWWGFDISICTGGY